MRLVHRASPNARPVPYHARPSETTLRNATIAVLVENEAGILARVVGLFSGRGYNIESLTVAPVDESRRLRASPSSPPAPTW